MSDKDKISNIETKKEDNQDELDHQQNNKKPTVNEADNSRKQESRMMNFFNQEFLERKIDFKPK
jgi:hypothetical protein